ncbi:hypothetical protein LPB137_05925 [Poseidonibacter parvus]|uniref:Solute-binding protein family 3/N-terminal domain-containing protein n=1 Tax=Poseidonibacter parvus TaxID=1850254 RepID=A0A1P8KLI0_9BACT|nr:PhnD/SsuA/transferrin family substrate-binding protein [Poseidonibacter parvus]APW65417.1 hypothetical protein LPB137_05925 [Poseidonibacter parvus]
MRNHIFSIFRIMLIILLPLQLLADDSSKLSGKMGYLIDGLSSVKYKDARIAFDLWKIEVTKNNDIDVSIKYLDTEKEIIKGYKNSEFEYISINPFFYLKNSKLIDSLTQTCSITLEGDKEFEQYVLLVKDKNIKTLKDLRGKKIGIENDDYLAKIFLEYESLKKLSKNLKKSRYEIVKTKKKSTAILNTYFGKIDACVVPISTYNLVQELNPSVSKKLRVLSVSQEIFMPLITFFHKDANKQFVDILINEINILPTTSQGQNILNLFKIKGVKKIECKKLEPLKTFYKKYELLKSSKK